MPTINIPQAKFLQLPHKFRAYVGGFGSGKTWAGCFSMCQRYYKYPKVNQGYFGPTFPHIRDIFYPTIEEVSHAMGLRVDIKEGNKEVHFYSGSKYRGTTIGRSMDRPGSIVGFKIGSCLIDELDILPSNKAQLAWRKIIARLRWQDAINGADVTTTPEGFNETYRLFVEDLLEKPHLNNTYGLVQASTRENEKNLPEGYIQSLEDTYPIELIDAYIDGRFCNLTSGTVYYAFDRRKHNSNEEVLDKEPLYIGMDFNVTKMAATVYVIRNYDEWHAVGQFKDIFDTPAMINAIKTRYASHHITVYPDASGDSRKTVNASVSDISLLNSAGFQVKANGSNPAVKDRILATNKRFQMNKLFVNCLLAPNVAKCFEHQAYDDNGEPDKKSGFDHQNDGSTYPIAYEFPILKPLHKVRISGH